MKVLGLFFFLLPKIIKSQNNFDEEYSYNENGVDYPDIIDENCFQTPKINDKLGNYKETYQELNYLVGYSRLKYFDNKKKCIIKIILKINPILRKKGINYKIIYKFGNYEQENNTKIISSNNSYPNGLFISVKIVDINNGKEIAKLELENIYFIWDNIKVSQDRKYENGQKGVIAELFGWPYDDIAEECEFLGHAGYMGVKIFSPNEVLLTYDYVENGEINPWWYIYQPVSYKLESRFGNKFQLRNMINKCRKYNVRIYSEIIINNMVANVNDMYKVHTNDDNSIYEIQTGSVGSPFWTTKGINQSNPNTNLRYILEFPSVPYCGSDFLYFKKISNCSDNFLVNLNIRKDYVQQRIADFITTLLSIGISGIYINNAKYISPNNFVSIFKKLKDNLDSEFPQDFIAVLELTLGNDKNILICENGDYSFSSSFVKKLLKEGFSNCDINKIKIWNSNFPNESLKCMDIWKISPERHAINIESPEDHYTDSIHQSYIKNKDIEFHKKNIINMIKSTEYNWKIKSIFSSYSLINDANGFPDGKSDCSKSKRKECIKSVPYRKAYDPLSTGYDTGNKNNWKEGKYTRVHRDLDIINSMREWLGIKLLTKEELYQKERLRVLDSPEEKPYKILSTGENVEDCDTQDFFNNICIINNEENKKAEEKLIKKIENQIIEREIDDLLESIINDEKKDLIFKNNKILIQITSSYNQNYRIYQNISTIELDYCEDILKDIYGINDEETLIILKVEYYEEGLLIPIIEYEVFHPTTKISLNLNFCNQTELSIYVNANINENNLNIYNTSSEYYTDMCSPSTSKYSTDINLEDRKKEYINNNLSICQENCLFREYEIISKKVYCECKAKTNFTFISEVGFDKNELIKNFLDINHNLNLNIMKCHKVLFTKEGFVKNIGNIILFTIILLYVISINIFSINGYSLFKKNINELMELKKENNIPHKDRININPEKIKRIIEKSRFNTSKNTQIKFNKTEQGEHNLKNEINDIKLNKNIKVFDNYIQIIEDEENNINESQKNFDNNKNNDSNCKEFETKINEDRIIFNQINFDSLNFCKNAENKRYSIKAPPKKKIKMKIKIKMKRKGAFDFANERMSSSISSRASNILIYSKNSNMNSTGNKWNKHEFCPNSNKNIILFRKKSIEKYNDYELNSLNFNQALEIDKRNFFQFYLSLLRTKHLLISTFFNFNDFNSIIVKICIFLFSLAIFLIMNALLYTNSTIHNIYENHGKYNLNSRIGQIIGATIISNVIYYIIKYVSISEREIIKLKNEKNIENLDNKILSIFKCLLVKFTLFFDISLFFLFLFWYYISCFCAVYRNTQSYLIKDALISLGFSLLYQFIINLIPGIFRIYSLKNKSKNRECIFKASIYLQVL